MKFLPNTLYHIYNRGNNRQVIFPQEKNYDFFLKKVGLELKGLCDLLAYCLMPNHFHLLIYISESSPGLNLLSNQNQQQLARKIGTIFQHFLCTEIGLKTGWAMSGGWWAHIKIRVVSHRGAVEGSPRREP